MPTWTRIVGLATLALACLAHAVPSDIDSADVHVKWNLAELPHVLKSRVHTKVTDLPPFPIDHSLLKDPNKWPATRVIAGVQCSLRVRGGTDGIRDMRSLEDLRPSDRYYCLYYRAPLGSSGPRYCWDRKGWIFEQSWHTPDSTREIYEVTTFWRSGEVLRREWRNDSKKPKGADPKGPYEWFEELFTLEGDLLACAYGKMDGSGSQLSACFWAGQEVTYARYGTHKLEFYRTAFPE